MASPLLDIYQHARNAVRARVADGGGGKISDGHAKGMSVGVTINKEAELMKRLYLRDHAPIPPESEAERRELSRYRPKELLDFVAERKRETDWAAVLSDPSSAAAMRQLQRRMKDINGTPGEYVESRWGSRVLNGLDGTAPSPKHCLLYTSPSPRD